MAEFVLYSYYRSSASYRVRIALYLKGIPFEYKAVHLLNNGGEQHKAEYRDLNPSRQVPTLLHKGHGIAQSMAILEYLDAVHTSRFLFPTDPLKNALVKQFCEIINCMQPLQNLSTMKYLKELFSATPAQEQAWMATWMNNGFTACEAMLEKYSGTYCFGETLTAADCFLVPQVFAAARFNIDLSKYPNIRRLNQSLLELEAFKKAHPNNQPDTP